MPGHHESRIWPSDKTRDAPPRHRPSCRYEVLHSAPLGGLEVRINGALAALVSEAEQVLLALNNDGGPALVPLARLLRRTESIDSSKVEGLQLGVRELARFRNDGDDGVSAWIEHFAMATLRAHAKVPRADAAASAIIDMLPAHPMISAPVATAVTQRSKSRVSEGIEQLLAAGVLVPLSSGQRNRWWEAAGLRELIGQLESGEYPTDATTFTTS